MNFFLYQVVARLVAMTVGYYSGQRLWHGFAERKIQYENDDWLDFFDWSKVIADRDTMPIRYWMFILLELCTFSACLVVSIFGWFVPNP